MAKSKKIAIVVAAIALIAVIGVVGSTLAYFTDTSTKNNTFTLGKVNGTLEEEGNPENIVETGMKFENVTPNADLVKKPFMVLGANSEKAYARVKLTWNTNDLSPEAKQMFEAYPPTLDIDNEHWVLGNDNYYYYQGILDKDKNNQTTKIFENVHIPAEWDNTMSKASFSLEVKGDLVQADNIDNQLQRNDAGKIVGWPVSEDQMQAANK